MPSIKGLRITNYIGQIDRTYSLGREIIWMPSPVESISYLHFPNHGGTKSESYMRLMLRAVYVDIGYGCHTLTDYD